VKELAPQAALSSIRREAIDQITQPEIITSAIQTYKATICLKVLMTLTFLIVNKFRSSWTWELLSHSQAHHIFDTNTLSTIANHLSLHPMLRHLAVPVHKMNSTGSWSILKAVRCVVHPKANHYLSNIANTTSEQRNNTSSRSFMLIYQTSTLSTSTGIRPYIRLSCLLLQLLPTQCSVMQLWWSNPQELDMHKGEVLARDRVRKP